MCHHMTSTLVHIPNCKDNVDNVTIYCEIECLCGRELVSLPSPSIPAETTDTSSISSSDLFISSGLDV